MNSICVIGLGYIGLPTSVLISQYFNPVIGVDTNHNVLDVLLKGECHIDEPGLNDLLKKTLKQKLLQFRSKPVSADVFIIAVPTPITSKLQPDLSFVFAAVKGIAPLLSHGNLVILESTCPVGTTNNYKDILNKERPDLCFDKEKKCEEKVNLAYCPERVMQARHCVNLLKMTEL